MIKLNSYILILLLLLFCFNPLLGMAPICIYSPFLVKFEQKIASIVIIIFSILFYATLQPFSDLAEYLHVYNNINSINIFHYTRFGRGIEFFILIIMKVVHFITRGDQFSFLVAIYSIIFILLMTICKKIADEFYLLLFFCIFFSYGFIQTNAYVLRQILSLLFILMMILAWNKKSIIFGFLSIISHTSAVIAIGLFVLIYIRKFKKLIYLIVPTSILTVFIAYKIGMFSYVIDRLISVDNNFSILSISQIAIYNSQIGIVFCLLYLFRNKINLSDKSVFLILFGILNFFLFWVFINIPAMSNRFALFMCAFSSILLYPILNSKINFTYKYKALMVVILVNLIPTLYIFYNVEMANNLFSFMNYSPIRSNIFDFITLLANRLTENLPYLTQGN